MPQLNALGVEIIKSYESCKLTPYRDPAGYWTVGWGHLVPVQTFSSSRECVDWLRDNGVEPDDTGESITVRGAHELLKVDLQKAVHGVMAAVSFDAESRLGDNRFSALVSLAYNIGNGAFAKSTLCRHVNAQRWDLAQDEFHKFRMAGGKVLQGLVRRRAVEAWLFGLAPSFQLAQTWAVEAGDPAAASTRQGVLDAPQNSVVVLLRPVPAA